MLLWEDGSEGTLDTRTEGETPGSDGVPATASAQAGDR
jgi:hypothetical protein